MKFNRFEFSLLIFTWLSIVIILGIQFLKRQINNYVNELISQKENLKQNSEKLLQEIEQRKQAEAELNIALEKITESEKLYQLIVQNSLVGITLSDKSKLVYANPKFIKMLGYSSFEEIKDIPFTELLSKESYEQLLGWRKIRDSNFEITNQYDWEFVKKDGTPGTARIYKSSVMVGIKHYSVGVYKETTTQKITEKALKLSEERNKKIVEVITDYVYRVYYSDNKMAKIEHNQACFGVTGYESFEFDENSDFWSDIVFISDKEKVTNFFYSPKNMTMGNSLEFRIIHKNGTIRWVNTTIIPFLDLNNQLIFCDGIVKDITEKKQLEQKVLTSILQAEEDERGRLARDLHDGVGPLLSAANMYLKAIEISDDQEVKKTSLTQISELITEASDSVHEISNNISPHILKNRGVVDAVRVFIAKIKNLDKIAIDIYSDLESRPNPNIETILYRVATELINNSLKYSKAKKISISFHKYDDNIELFYSDDGIGFNLEEILKKGSGMGIQNIIHRIKSLLGDVLIIAEPEKGMSAIILINSHSL